MMYARVSYRILRLGGIVNMYTCTAWPKQKLHALLGGSGGMPPPPPPPPPPQKIFEKHSCPEIEGFGS